MTPAEEAKFRNQVATRAAEIAREKYPSPYWDRMYEFPRGYQNPEVLKKRVGEWLGTPVLLSKTFPGAEHDAGAVTYAAVAEGLHEHQFPLYLLTKPLTQMLAFTDWPDDCSLDDDASPPYPACTFALPVGWMGDSDGARAWAVSYAIVEHKQTKRRVFAIACCMDGDFGYYGRYRISESGQVVIEEEAKKVFEMCAQGAENGKMAEVTLPAGAAFLEGMLKFVLTLFVYLNIDKKKPGGTQPEELIKTIKPKGPGMPRREQKKAAMIGVNLIPSGFATHGTHASPCTHLRRGHMRWVWFGKGKTEKERRFFPATIVNQRIDHKDDPEGAPGK